MCVENNVIKFLIFVSYCCDSMEDVLVCIPFKHVSTMPEINFLFVTPSIGCISKDTSKSRKKYVYIG